MQWANTDKLLRALTHLNCKRKHGGSGMVVMKPIRNPASTMFYKLFASKLGQCMMHDAMCMVPHCTIYRSNIPMRVAILFQCAPQPPSPV